SAGRCTTWNARFRYVCCDSKGATMIDLGMFSVSLAVQDLQASRAFYEKLGFKKLDGDEQSWLILENGGAKIGLFQGMFDKNILTFNTSNVREIQQQLKAQGMSLIEQADESSDGPAQITLVHPDGNPILFDQY